MKKVYRYVFVVFMVALALGMGVAVSRAAVDTYFQATGTTTFSGTAAEYTQHDIHMTDDADAIRMAGGNDFIYMSGGNDEINMGPGSDKISFYGQTGQTPAEVKKLVWNSTETSYFEYTPDGDTLKLRINQGDFIIHFGS